MTSGAMFQVERTGSGLRSPDSDLSAGLQGTICLPHPVCGISQLTLEVAGNRQFTACITVDDGNVLISLEDFFYVFLWRRMPGGFNGIEGIVVIWRFTPAVWFCVCNYRETGEPQPQTDCKQPGYHGIKLFMRPIGRILLLILPIS